MATPPIALQLSVQEIEQRKRLVGWDADDVQHIARINALFIQNVADFSAAFFDFLRSIDEHCPLFRQPALLQEAIRMKEAHLLAMAGGDYGQRYVEERVALGLLYSQVGIDVRVFMGAFHHLQRTIGSAIMAHFPDDPQGAFLCVNALQKIGDFDLGLIVDVLIGERERTISKQQEAIRELSTPVLQVRDRLLILPIIGVIDTLRAKQLTDGLLLAIRANRAKIVVMDVTGVAAVDSKVANHLLQTVAAARLMGARVIVTGLSSDVAQAMVALGVDLGSLTTLGDLQGGVEAAERLLGFQLVPLKDVPPI
ncbi:protoglobin domain-containing protein [Paludibacterium purpuratum]|uniref:RsbT co-antagonist protein RsbR n=1 Tax=Paludibacterium purpuratum TaxID=1144873 RepID=A0A4R7AZL3_9NEIS|nr:protoglobin domain-containing protein [Paludibacterium purpuratum]TDR73885.1 rsbT co-antagonist protein RsbR [Paludibacterium purpuratum]